LDALRAKRLAEGAPANSSDARIRHFQRVVTSTIVPAPPTDRRRIAFGSFVGLRHGDGETARYRIVGLEESNPAEGLISWLSPLAKALISHAPGETVRFQTPGGEETLTILSVERPDP
jgi:transcription elongation factor GreB